MVKIRAKRKTKLRLKQLKERENFFTALIISKGLISSKINHILKINKIIIKIPVDKSG